MAPTKFYKFHNVRQEGVVSILMYLMTTELWFDPATAGGRWYELNGLKTTGNAKHCCRT